MRYRHAAACAVPKDGLDARAGRTPASPLANAGAKVRWLTAGLLLALAAAVKPAQAQMQDDYTVKNVPMQATAGDAVAARQQALEGAERRGLQLLIERLSNQGPGTAPSVDDVPIDRIVQSYEIASEEVGAKSYKGTLNIMYAPTGVRDLMSRRNIAIVHQRQPTLIVPAVAGDSGLGLWFDADAWRGALGTSAAHDPSLKLNLPLADAQDMADLSAAQAAAGDGEAFGKLQERYQVRNVVLAILNPGAGGAPASVTLKNVLGGAIRGDASIPVPPGDDAMSAAADAAIAALRDGGVKKAPPPPETTQTLGVVVPLVDIGSWVQIRRDLEQVADVKSIQIDSFSRMQAVLTLTFAGDVNALQSTLNGRGLTLLSENGQWRLQRAGASAPGTL